VDTVVWVVTIWYRWAASFRHGTGDHALWRVCRCQDRLGNRRGNGTCCARPTVRRRLQRTRRGGVAGAVPPRRQDQAANLASDGDVQASLESIRLDFGAYPDGRIEVQQVVVQARHAVVEFQFEGTNTEPLTLFNGQQVPATGRPLRLEGAIVLEFDAAGLITCERQFWEVFPLVEFWIGMGLIRT
jgi:hypothetical protein